MRLGHKYRACKNGPACVRPQQVTQRIAIEDIHMIFRQLVEPLSNTYTYLIACEETRLALLIDPVVNSVDWDLNEIRQLGLTLAFTLDTHIHADHITGALQLK